jgi:hypothetical protein
MIVLNLGGQWSRAFESAYTALLGTLTEAPTQTGLQLTDIKCHPINLQPLKHKPQRQRRSLTFEPPHNHFALSSSIIPAAISPAADHKGSRQANLNSPSVFKDSLTTIVSFKNHE